MTDVVSKTPGFASLAGMRARHRELLQLTARASPHGEERAQVLAFLQSAASAGSVLDARADRSAAQALLDYWVGVLHSWGGAAEGEEVPDALLAPFDPATAPDLADRATPYLGLAAFDVAEAAQFFGRREAKQELLAKLEDHPIVIVSGPSGSGKSSLVLAGLIATLQSDARGPSRHVLPVVVPGSDPLAALLLATRPPESSAPEWVATHRASIAEAPASFRALAQGRAPDRPLVLVVDQLEELFSLCRDAAAREQFAAAVVALATDSPHRVVLTVRDDYLDDAFRLSALVPLAGDEGSRYAPRPLSADELREVVERPAEMVGLKFDDGIVDELVSQVRGEPTALPLLQFALQKLWEKKTRNRISRETYQLVGSPREALQRAADKVFADLPEGRDQVVTRLVFLDLVELSVGVEYVRRRVRRETLHRHAPSTVVDEVLRRFAAAGLLRITPGQDTDDDRVEVAHEALIRNWGLLAGWLEEAREKLRKRARLRAAAELSQSTNWHAGTLLSGPLLDEVKGYPDLDTEEPVVGELVRRSEAFRLQIREEERKQRGQRLRARNLRMGYVAITAFVAVALLSVAYRTAAVALEKKAAAQAEEQRAVEEAERARVAERQAEEEAKTAAASHAELKTKVAELIADPAALSALANTSTEQRAALEELSITTSAARPALTVCDDQIDDVIPPQWAARVRGREAEIGRVIRSTGRVEFSGHDLEWGGTAFVVGNDLVVVPWYVAEVFLTSEGRPQTGFAGPVGAWINFDAEKCGLRGPKYRIRRLVYRYVGEGVRGGGIAFLQTDPLDRERIPLQLAERPPASDSDVFTVSYPMSDQRLPKQIVELVLGSGGSGVKRWSPGRLVGLDRQEVHHDCTTMGGSGGSPLVALESGEVVGIHLAGLFSGGQEIIKENFALASWTLLEDVEVRALLRSRRELP